MSEMTAYDLYMKNLRRVRRVSNAQQRALALEGTKAARTKLNEQALLIVVHVFQRMQARDRLATVDAFDMDALQEASVEAMAAVPKWDPLRGTLATWIIPHVKGALLNYANTHTNGGIGSKHNKLVQVAIDEVIASEELSEAQDSPGMESSVPITLEESLAYEEDLVIPSAEHDALLQQVNEHAWMVRDGAMLMAHYLQEMSIKDLARVYEVSQDTIRRRLANAVADLASAVNDDALSDTSNTSESQS